jgi:hypothetical protein
MSSLAEQISTLHVFGDQTYQIHRDVFQQDQQPLSSVNRTGNCHPPFGILPPIPPTSSRISHPTVAVSLIFCCQIRNTSDIIKSLPLFELLQQIILNDM